MSEHTISAPVMPKMARNRSALHDVLAQGASNRDIMVYLQLSAKPYHLNQYWIVAN